jgi:hypothetical protein
MYFADDCTEEIECPFCQAKFELKVRMETNADVQASQRITADGFAMDKVPFKRRVPNLGGYGEFWRGHLADDQYITNGKIALRKTEKVDLDLELDLDLERESSSLEVVVEKIAGELREIVPHEMTKWLVRFISGADKRVTLRRRDVDFIYALYPDAKFYVGKDPGCIICKDGGEICAFVMGMRLACEHEKILNGD